MKPEPNTATRQFCDVVVLCWCMEIMCVKNENNFNENGPNESRGIIKLIYNVKKKSH